MFQYHGAEHMTIHALEAGDPLVVDAVRKYPTAHPRCGTEFLVVVIALSIVAFSLVGRQEPLVMVGSRILLIPVIAAVGYEILKWGAKHRGNAIVRTIMYPGILVQMITTKQPTDDMIEVAIVSMEEALAADGEATAGAGPRARPVSLPRARWSARAPSTRPALATGTPRGARHDRSAAPGSMSGDADRTGLDARLREVVSQYDDVQAQARDPGGLARSRSAPDARPRALAARAGRPGVPGARGDPRPSWPARARCATAPTPIPR